MKLLKISQVRLVFTLYLTTKYLAELNLKRQTLLKLITKQNFCVLSKELFPSKRK
jgi:hypothetical protein